MSSSGVEEYGPAFQIVDDTKRQNIGFIGDMANLVEGEIISADYIRSYRSTLLWERWEFHNNWLMKIAMDSQKNCGSTAVKDHYMVNSRSYHIYAEHHDKPYHSSPFSKGIFTVVDKESNKKTVGIIGVDGVLTHLGL